MKFEKILNESYKRYKLRYVGTRDDYEIHDKNPYVIVLDDDYNVDGNGKSILGINVNYYNGDVKALIDEINKLDNAGGFKSFEMKSMLKKSLARDKDSVEDWIIDSKKKRYKNFKGEFPHILKYLRRYKIKGPKGTGIQKKKRARKK
jgi:hypothetical protein